MKKQKREIMENQKVDYHYCPKCGFIMSDVEFYSIIAEVACPGRGDKQCGIPIGRFLTRYIEESNVQNKKEIP